MSEYITSFLAEEAHIPGRYLLVEEGSAPNTIIVGVATFDQDFGSRQIQRLTLTRKQWEAITTATTNSTKFSWAGCKEESTTGT